MSFALYIVGFLLIIAGIAWALDVAGVSTIYIAITSLILLGVGVLTGVTKTRPRDRPKGPLS